MTIRAKFIESIRDAIKVNRGVQSTPAVILWTDKDRVWEPVLPKLADSLPELLVLGAYAPERRTGPAIWLKCAIAKKLGDGSAAGDAVPVIYLPGISRSELRAIESCPRELQPLAELQYRGVFWSQANAKDWTFNAFLTSKNGGLGLDVLQDKATQDALQRVLAAGVFFEHSVADLKSRQINAAFLDGLLAPNPARDVLAWLNDAELARSQWQGGHWELFVARCRSDFGFDLHADGALSAAEKLASRAGAWAAVWELYSDSFVSFPKVADHLAKVKAPKSRGLFDEPTEMAGYLHVNEEAEAALRGQLHAMGAMAMTEARASVVDIEKNHGYRRDWLWSRMGRSPLALALGHLVEIVSLSGKIPGGATPDQMADKYRENGWKVDSAALKAIAAAQSKADSDAVSAALRAIYVPWLEDTANHFQKLTIERGRLSDGVPQRPADINGHCTIFVDGLRYDVAMRLKEPLGSVGEVSLSSSWTSIPSVTASGKAWASPVAQFVGGKVTNEEFEPCVKGDDKPLNAYNFRKLLGEHDIQVLDKHETGDPTGKAWVECGDLDHYGHAQGLRLARDLDAQLLQIVERTMELAAAGWTSFRIVTDHGWLLVPGKLPKSELSKHEAKTKWGRCAVLKESSHGTALTFGWDWCKDVQIAMAPGISSFIAGDEYAHGGLTLQECLVPVIEVRVHQTHTSTKKVDITKVTWKGLRCQIQIAPSHAGLTADIRTKAALAESSVLAKVKMFEDGKASVAVPDDAYMDAAAFVVVLDASGAIVQKIPTTIGDPN